MEISKPAPPLFPLPREIYEPAEDSRLLTTYVKRLKGKRACDMGTGSGIVATALAAGFEKVVAVDINPFSGNSHFPKNVTFVESDLFSNVLGKFDLIAFNSPYLPGYEDRRWSCGKGEVILRFLEEAKRHISKGGKLVLLISSLTPEAVSNRARRIYSVKVVGEERLPGFETLFLLELSDKPSLALRDRKHKMKVDLNIPLRNPQ